MVLRGATSLLGALEGGGPKSRLFWAQMALASLVPFQDLKKSRFSGPTPSNAPRNDVAPLKTIMYRAIKTTGTLIVNTVYKSGEHFLVNKYIMQGNTGQDTREQRQLARH